MGQAIVYCSACSTQVRGSDFEKGLAFKVRDQTFCAPCGRGLGGAVPGKPLPADRSAPPMERRAGTKSGTFSSSQTRKVPPPPREPPPRKRAVAWILGGGMT